MQAFWSHQIHSFHMHLKILQVRFQQYVNCELPDVQAGFRKHRVTRDQFVNIHWIIQKTRKLQENIFCFIDYAKALPDHLTCLLRNLYAGQEAKVRTGHGTADLFQIRKGVHQGCILYIVYCHPAYVTYMQSTS